MSNALFPVPIDTPVSDETKFAGLKFGSIWMRFLKAISDDLLAANILNNLAPSTITSTATLTPAQLRATAQGIKWVLNANLCVVTVSLPESVAEPVEFALPFTAAAAFDVNGTFKPAGAKSVTIPAMTTYFRFWYIASATKQGA